MHREGERNSHNDSNLLGEARGPFGFSSGVTGVMEGVRGFTWATFEEKAREFGMNCVVNTSLLSTMLLHVHT